MIYCNWAATAPNRVNENFNMLNQYIRTGYTDSFMDVREKLCGFFAFDNPYRLVFGSGLTDLMNKLIFGSVKYRKEVILTTCTEHNSVLRPLYHLNAQQGVGLRFVTTDKDGILKIDDIEKSINDDVGLLIINHASNVTGVIQPIKEIVEIAHKRGAYVIVDCAQTAGRIDISHKEIGADAYVMSAHKGLMGMSGLGFALIGEGFEPEPVFFGGTGIYSEAKEQPYELPYRLEAGTPNYIAINSLKNSIDYLIGNEYIRLNAECNKMFQLFVEELKGMSHVELIGLSTQKSLPIANIRVAGYSVEELSYILLNVFDIIARHGIHCAPLMHQRLNTAPFGTVRLSFGITNTEKDFDYIINTLRRIKK